MVLSVFAKSLLFALILLGVFPGLPASTTLFFTNDHSIEKIQNNSATPVIQVAMAPQALDCNSCDQRIYWASQEEKAIKRGFPSSNSQDSNVETILDLDLVKPRGLAVDWRGDNVYFTDDRGDGVSHLEVITCDGLNRRVLFDDLKAVGPLTVDPVHGHIYWGEFTNIMIADMDGSNRSTLITLDDDSRVEDIAIDYDNNLLYWIDKQLIYHAFLNGTGKVAVGDHILNHTTPSGVSISQNILYWTQQQTTTFEGAIYSYSLTSNLSDGLTHTVVSDSDLNPQDISTFVSEDITGQVSGGCSEKNGECSHFCFTLPALTDPFSSPTSRHRCGCPTGLTFKVGSIKLCRLIPNDFLLFVQAIFSPDTITNACASGPAEKSQISMLSLDVEYRIPVVLPIEINAESSDVAYDLTNSLVYWTEHNPPAIKRASLDGTNVETVVSKDLQSPNKIALDSSYDTLFWTDSVLNRVEVMSLYVGTNSAQNGGVPDGKRRVLATTGLNHPFGIALNESSGMMYWTDQSSDPLIQKATLNGTINDSFTDTAFMVTAIHEPGAIAVRLSTDEVYWAETQDGEWAIEQAHSDGTSDYPHGYIDLEDEPYDCEVAGMAFLGMDKLYFTDRHRGRLFRADLNAVPAGHSPTPVLVLEGIDHPRGIVAIHSQDAPMNKGCIFDNGNCEDICVPGQGDDSSRQCICRENYRLVSDTNCEQERNPLLLLSNGSIVAVLEKEKWQVTNVNPINDSALHVPAGAMDVDYRENILYWISTEDGWIYRTYLNSSNYTDPVTKPVATCCYAFSDIAVDWWGRSLYWVDGTNGVLGVVKLNGNSLQVMASDLKNPVNLVAHPEFGTLYFIENSTNYIESISMSGGDSSSVEVIYQGEMPIVDLVLDAEKNFLFWSSENCIYEYNLEENSLSLPEFLCTEPTTKRSAINVGPPTLLAYYSNDVFLLDKESQAVLFHDELDPEKAQTTTALHIIAIASFGNSYDAAAAIQDMIFVDPSVQPGTHECIISNGECEEVEEAVCIVTGAHSHECLCSPTQYLELDTNIFGASRCHSTDVQGLLVISTPQQILYLPLVDLPTSDSSCEEYQNPPVVPRELPFGPLNNVTAVAFDPVHDSVVWYDQATGTISRANRNATTRTKLADVPSSSIPRSFAYDWLGGQFFLVDQLEFQINMYTVNNFSGVILNQNPYEGDMALDEPSVVAVNSQTRELYFADKYHLTINKVDLDTLKVSRFLPEGFRKLSVLHLAVDELNDIVYWYDIISMALEMYRIEEQNASLITHSAPQHISSLTATNLVSNVDSNSPALYWFNQTDHSIYWYNSVAVKRLLIIDSKFKDVTGMAAFDLQYEMMLTINTPCAESDRPCSHLCVPSQANSDPPNCVCTQYLQKDANGFCSASGCSDLSVPCSNSDTCIPTIYFCDGIDHCPSGSDESNCLCADNEFYCYDSEKCINENAVCNGIEWECPNNEDEKYCCETVQCPMKFNKGAIGCLYGAFICDGIEECVDGEDEKGCATSVPTTAPAVQPNPSRLLSSSPSPSVLASDSLTHLELVLFVLPVLLIIVVIMVVCLTVYFRRTCKKAPTQFHFPENLSFQSSTSPQPSHMRSDVTSEFSIKTMETGSTHVDRSSGTNGINLKRLSTYSTDPSNPPNSPINTPHSVAGFSVVSEFDPGVPPVPNPSVNYDDTYSDRFSSVSQTRFPATIPSHSNNVALYRRNNGLPAYPLPPYASHYYSTGYPTSRFHQQHLGDHDTLDNISESTVSLSTFHPELADNTSYTATSFCEQSVDTVESHPECTYPYNEASNEAPPPSPVTEYDPEAFDHAQ